MKHLFPKALSLVLVACLLLGMAAFVPGKVGAEASGTCGENITWTYEENTATLTLEGTGVMADYEKEEDLPWAEYVESIKKIVVEDGIETIGKLAFSGCTALEEVELPETLETVEEAAFKGCEKLVKVDLSETKVTVIAEEAFSGCVELEEVKVSATLKTVEKAAFKDCVKLIKVDLSETKVTEIAEETFSGCAALAEVNLPATVEAVDAKAFTGAESLEVVTVVGNAVKVEALMKDVELPTETEVIPIDGTAAPVVPVETTPTETVPVETTPAETVPAETVPAETVPAETVPAETVPAETVPAETVPAETVPAETVPAETVPAETVPAETTPVETTPAETTPAETTPVETTKVYKAIYKVHDIFYGEEFEVTETWLGDEIVKAVWKHENISFVQSDYIANGCPTKVEWFLDGKPLKTATVSYNDKNQEIKQHFELVDNEPGYDVITTYPNETTVRQELVYDGGYYYYVDVNGVLVEGGSVDDERVFQVFYSPDGKMKLAEEYINGVLTFRDNYENGLSTSSEFYVNGVVNEIFYWNTNTGLEEKYEAYDENGKLGFVSYSEYDSNRRLVKMTFTDGDGNITGIKYIVDDHTSYYEVYTEGKVTEIRYLVNDNIVKKEFLDENGEIVRIEEQVEDGVVKYTNVTSWGVSVDYVELAAGRIARSENYDNDGNLNSCRVNGENGDYYVYRYEFDQAVNAWKETYEGKGAFDVTTGTKGERPENAPSVVCYNDVYLDWDVVATETWEGNKLVTTVLRSEDGSVYIVESDYVAYGCPSRVDRYVDGEVNEFFTYEYNEKNQVILTHFEIVGGMYYDETTTYLSDTTVRTDMAHSVIGNIYNIYENGVLIENGLFRADGGAVYRYTSNGSIAEMEEYDANGELVTKVVNEYSEAGLPTKSTTVVADEGTTITEYDAEGNKVKETKISEDGVHEDIEEYENGKLVHVELKNNGIVHIAVWYEDDFETRVIWYNGDGSTLIDTTNEKTENGIITTSVYDAGHSVTYKDLDGKTIHAEEYDKEGSLNRYQKYNESDDYYQYSYYFDESTGAWTETYEGTGIYDVENGGTFGERPANAPVSAPIPSPSL